MQDNDSRLTELLAAKDEAAFEQVFKTYFKNLHGYALSMLKEETAAEEMVQNVFCKLWERAGNLSLSGSLAAYLYRAVHNESLNYLKHQKVKAGYGLHVSAQVNSGADSASKKLHLKELEARLLVALNELPEQCRTIFQLSRFEELRYGDIALRMGLSVKTVENQMSKALKLLRHKLADYLPTALYLLFHYLNNNS